MFYCCTLKFRFSLTASQVYRFLVKLALASSMLVFRTRYSNRFPVLYDSAGLKTPKYSSDFSTTLSPQLRATAASVPYFETASRPSEPVPGFTENFLPSYIVRWFVRAFFLKSWGERGVRVVFFVFTASGSLGLGFSRRHGAKQYTVCGIRPQGARSSSRVIHQAAHAYPLDTALLARLTRAMPS